MIKTFVGGLAAAALLALMSTTAQAAGPKVVKGPSADPECFVPWSDKT
eukprot:gene51480-70092_t